jgi:hypothetical protein
LRDFVTAVRFVSVTVVLHPQQECCFSGPLRYSVGVTDIATPASTEPDAGLCATCLHVRRIEAPHGSVFYLCDLSFADARFPKYPRLPVVSCEGFKKKE